jgi:hypothetical protein
MFGRMWSLDIDGDVFIAGTDKQSFRVEFDVTVSPGNAISFADVRISNLAKGSSIRQGASIRLSAGYKDNHDVIFTGSVTNALKERNGADIITRLLCRSGLAGSDRLQCTASYGRGATVVDVIRDLAAAWPRQLDIDETQFTDAPRMTSGYAVNGDIPTVLNELGYSYNFKWTQHNGRLIVTKSTDPRATDITEVNQFTGMVGMPEVTLGQNGLGVFVVVALNPQLGVNGRINVTSDYSTFNTGNLYISENSGDATANGEYNIQALRHRGDSHGSQWVTELEGLRPGIKPDASPSLTPSAPGDGTLVWGANVSQPFRVKTREVAGRLGFDPDWLMAVMAFETGESFSPSEKNRAGGSATGLIQFTSSTARDLGTTTLELSRMTAVNQLDYVEKYYSKYKKAINNLGDCYMKVLYPIAVGKPDSYVMWIKDDPVTGKFYNANANLDTNKNDQITRGEAVSRVDKALKKGRGYAK